MSDRIIDYSDRPSSKAGMVQRWPAMLLTVLGREFRQFRERRRNRRDLPVLRALNDHMLADIGLHRGDLAYIARHGMLPRHNTVDGR